MNFLAHSKNLIIVALASIFTLSACGGGGGGDQPVPPVPPQPPAVTLDNYADAASVASISSIDSLLQIGYIGQQTMLAQSSLRLDTELSCSNGGLYEHVLIDNDSNQTLSLGDRLTTNYMECHLNSLNGVADGHIVYDIESLDALQNFQLVLDASNLTVDNSITLFGDLRIAYTAGGFETNLSITTINSLEVKADNELLLTLSDLSINKNEVYGEAKYSIVASGSIKDEYFGGSYSFSQITPFSGYFNEFPNDGEMSIAVSSSDFLTIKSNFVENSYQFDVSYKDVEISIPWFDAIDGALMALNGQVAINVSQYRSDNFTFLKELNNEELTSFGLNDSLHIMFSRPVQSIEATYNAAAFEANEWPYETVSANVDIQGALLTITPSESLKADKTYSIRGMSAISMNEQTAHYYGSQVTTKNDIIPLINSQTNLYRYGDTPWLSALESINNTAGDLSYEWKELSSVGLVFDTPTNGQTNFTVPENANEDILVEVTITNQADYSVAQTMTISFVSSEATLLSYDSPAGDYIGGGQSRFYTAEQGEFSLNYNAASPNYIGFNYNGSDWWGLDLVAASGESIAVGIYEGARRYPFQSPTLPGLSFTGSGRGCNQSIGMFEIIELVIDGDGVIERLAVNFEQSCELTMPTLKGQARYNSQAPLNPR